MLFLRKEKTMSGRHRPERKKSKLDCSREKGPKPKLMPPVIKKYENMNNFKTKHLLKWIFIRKTNTNRKHL